MTPDEEKTLDESTVQCVRDIKVVGTLLNGDKLCDHAYAMIYGNNFEEPFSMIICPACQLQGPKAKTGEQAKIEFWKGVALDRGRYLELMKGMKPMSTEDYKRGVEDATDTKLWIGAGLKPGGELVAEKLAEIRKKLLTKKVTKWTGVIKSNYSGQPCLLDLYDDEAEINYYYTISPALCPPIKLEIEIPL